MKGLRRTRSLWERFCFREVDGAPWGLLRITYALAALGTALELAPLLEEHFTDAGGFTLADARDWGGARGVTALMMDPLGDLGAVLFMFGLLLASLVALLLGRWCRTSAVVSVLLLAWFQARNPTLLHGGDDILRLTGLCLAVGFLALPPGDRAFSLDRRRWVEKGGEAGLRAPSMPAWPLRLVQIQVVLMYTAAGFFKLQGSAWWDGSAVALAVGNPVMTRFGLPDWPELHLPFFVLGAAAALWQLLFGPLVVWRKTRAITLLFGVAFHGAILLTMNLGFFAVAVLATYPVFLDAGSIRRGLEKLPLAGRNRTPLPASLTPLRPGE